MTPCDARPRRASHLPFIAIVLAVAGTMLANASLRADSFVSLPDRDYSDDHRLVQTDPRPHAPVGAIVYPVLGFPSVVAPGDSIEVLVAHADGGATTAWAARLVTAVDPAPQTVPLVVTGHAWDAATDTYLVSVAVPDATPEDTFDLVVTAATLPGGEDRQRNAVRVRRERGRNLRIVHVADGQLQDVSTLVSPLIAAQTLEEIRLLQPDLVIYSGDIAFGGDYVAEYRENYELFAGSGLAIHLAPGNHDGYATIIPTASTPADDPPGQLARDGLHYWADTYGPTHYAFRLAGFRFVAMNTYDGEAKRRNGLGFFVGNFGGQVDPAQLAWIADQTRAGTDAGEDVILIGHHDPRGPITPNRDSYPWPAPRGSFQIWNDQGSSDELLRLIANDHVTAVLLGHEHGDEHDELVVNAGAPDERRVPFIKTTTLSEGALDRHGYRLIEIRDGRIDRIDYEPGQQSIPAGLGRRVFAVLSGANDGREASLTAALDNRLTRTMTITLELTVATTPDGLAVTAAAPLTASVREVVATDVGASKAYVEVTLPPLTTAASLELAPAVGGGGLQPGFQRDAPGGSSGNGGGGTTTPGATTPPAPRRLGGGGGGGGGCRGGNGTPGSLAPLLLLAAAMLVLGTRRAR